MIQALLAIGSNGLEIIEHWNGVANEGETGTIAVKTDEDIDKCVWRHDGKKYSSEDRRPDGYEVDILKRRVCKLSLDKADKSDHQSDDWRVKITGKRCRNKRQAPELPSVVAGLQASGQQVASLSGVLSNLNPNLVPGVS